MDLQTLIDNLFTAAMIGGIGFGVNFLQKLSESINSLNNKISIVIQEIGNHDHRLTSLEKKAEKLRGD